MKYKLKTLILTIAILIFNLQQVYAYIPYVLLDENASTELEFNIENIYDAQEIEFQSLVLDTLQRAFFMKSLQEEFAYVPTNKIFIDQSFDNMFFYGIELELPTLIENIKLLTSIEGEYANYDIEKSIYSNSGISYEFNDQFAVDCIFEAGVYDAESSKSVLFGTTVRLNIF